MSLHINEGCYNERLLYLDFFFFFFFADFQSCLICVARRVPVKERPVMPAYESFTTRQDLQGWYLYFCNIALFHKTILEIQLETSETLMTKTDLQLSTDFVDHNISLLSFLEADYYTPHFSERLISFLKFAI